jgi:hypothetical protein
MTTLGFDICLVAISIECVPVSFLGIFSCTLNNDHPQEDIEKMSNKPGENLVINQKWSTNLQWTFYILATLWKPKYKNLTIFANFFSHFWWFKPSKITSFVKVAFWIKLFGKIFICKKTKRLMCSLNCLKMSDYVIQHPPGKSSIGNRLWLSCGWTTIESSRFPHWKPIL